jgi:putative Holliday junction resolvase
MARILAIDYGTKRVGLAVTDENKIIARALDTVHSKDILKYLADYLSKEKVEHFVIGHPRQMSGAESEIKPMIDVFIKQLEKAFPQIPISRYDERFTSKMASQALLESGLKKKDRQNKGLVDMTSAVIILQSYLEMKK